MWLRVDVHITNSQECVGIALATREVNGVSLVCFKWCGAHCMAFVMMVACRTAVASSSELYVSQVI